MINICVISGSPKGANSITYHTVLWIEKNFKNECRFETFHVGKSRKATAEAAEGIRRADIVLFCYPVYTFMAPSQLHYAMESLKAVGVMHGKCYAQITTSKHFYDTTAHAYIRENCADMGMVELGVFSADMEDLTTSTGRAQAADFWQLVLWRYRRAVGAAGAAEKILRQKSQPEADGRRIALIASLKDDDDELSGMIEQFRQQSPFPVDLINIEKYPFQSGCISCFNCAADGTCIFKDGFDKFLRERIQTASAMVYAFRIQDHSMGPRMKLYDDRQFCNGHRTVTMGMPVGYIVAGDLSAERNLDMIIRARADVGGNFLCGVADSGVAPFGATPAGAASSSAEQLGVAPSSATPAVAASSGAEQLGVAPSSATPAVVAPSGAEQSVAASSGTIPTAAAQASFERKLGVLCDTLEYAISHKLRQPQTFLGIGGMKIFRDLIYQMQGLMRADHKFFKSHGQYDFPQKHRGTIIKMYLVGLLMNSPKLRSKAGGKIAEGMVKPYRDAVEENEELFD